ncbi:MAG TPA: hypothetical protein VFK41_06215 [Nocardioidaceae bacterium]|nr:hypothetical protein [Nocardioidaceae bacterium]
MSDNERLSRELRNRADNLGGHPISLDDVKRSATKMKRQRTAAAGAVAAVALAVAIPVGFSVAGNGGGGTTPIAVEPTITETTTVTPTKNPDGKYTLTLDAPEGDAPRISWLDKNTLHTASGDTFELPKAYGDVASYRGGFMGSDGATGKIDVIRDGQVESSFNGGGFAVSEDGTLVAWFDRDASAIKVGIASGAGEGETSYDVPVGLNATPVAFRGSDVIYQTDDQNNGDRKVWYTDGDVTHEIEGALAVDGYSSRDDVAMVMTSLDDFGSCWGTFAFPGGEFAGKLTQKTCDFSLGQVSSDGQYVIGWDAYRDGWGNGDIAILDASTFKPVAHFEPAEDYGVQHAAWDADTDSLMVAVYLDGTWQLLRLGVDGSVESASEGIQADSEAYPLKFASAR